MVSILNLPLVADTLMLLLVNLRLGRYLETITCISSVDLLITKTCGFIPFSQLLTLMITP